MIRDKYNIIPKFMAAMLHALFIASFLFVFDFSMSETTARPLVIEATLVSAAELETVPPPVVEPAEPEPDNSERERIEAEEATRLEELAREQARIEAAEKKRQEQLAQEQQRIREQKETEDRKKREEAELERKRVAAEKKRQDDIERKRKENELARQLAIAKEAEDLRLRELAEEEARLAAINSSAMARYQFALQQKIMRNWVAPASAQPGIECVVDVRQSPGGDVISVMVGICNGDAAVRRSIEAAVLKASPLPKPQNRNLFRRDLRITFKPEE